MPNQLIRRKKAKRQGPVREAGDPSLATRSGRTAVPDGERADCDGVRSPRAAFARNPNRVLSRERLLDLAHNHDTGPFDRSIDLLRRKIESKPLLIKTMRGAGYMFVPSCS